MELPFLKNKKKNQGGGIAIEREASPTHDSDRNMDDALLDQVAEEFLKAIETKDKSLLREALGALVLHIQDEDREQDKEDQS